jgi:hypothetical protein
MTEAAPGSACWGSPQRVHCGPEVCRNRGKVRGRQASEPAMNGNGAGGVRARVIMPLTSARAAAVEFRRVELVKPHHYDRVAPSGAEIRGE